MSYLAAFKFSFRDNVKFTQKQVPISKTNVLKPVLCLFEMSNIFYFPTKIMPHIIISKRLNLNIKNIHEVLKSNSI